MYNAMCLSFFWYDNDSGLQRLFCVKPPTYIDGVHSLISLLPFKAPIVGQKANFHTGLNILCHGLNLH